MTSCITRSMLWVSIEMADRFRPVRPVVVSIHRAARPATGWSAHRARQVWNRSESAGRLRSTDAPGLASARGPVRWSV